MRLAACMKLRVVVADDTPSMLRHLILLLQTDCEVVAAVENGRLALECIQSLTPDLVVLDLKMPGLNGIEVTRESKKLSPAPAIVICSVETDPGIVAKAQQAGALGYVFKMHMDRDLIKAVKCAAQGEPFASSL